MTAPAPESDESSARHRAELAAITEALIAGRLDNRADARLLREVVRSYALHAREDRVPPERLLVALKQVVREVAQQDASDAYRVIYTDRVIAWAIESYYGLDGR